MRILISGSAGFIGHHLVDYLFKNTDWDIVGLDRLDTSGNLNRLADLDSWEENKTRFKHVYHDLKAPINEEVDKMIGDVDYIIHLAASTHVDRSITEPLLFVLDNVVGTTNILNFALKRQKAGTLKKIINFSTDEVFGPAPPDYEFKENDRFTPSNPYAASKAGAVEMGVAYHVTYGLNIITTYTVNNFGERQKPEKLMPKAIRCIINDEEMPIYSEIVDGKLKSVGTRFWIHCLNTASALHFLLLNGKNGEHYNVSLFDEISNEDVVRRIGKIIKKEPIINYVDFHEARPGHDRRYGLDGSKLRDLGWKPELDFDESLKRYVKFTLNNPDWQ